MDKSCNLIKMDHIYGFGHFKYKLDKHPLHFTINRDSSFHGYDLFKINLWLGCASSFKSCQI